MTDLSGKFASQLAAENEREGISIAPEDNKLAYLRLLSAIPFEVLLEGMILNLETLVSAAQLYLTLNIGSANPDFTGITGCATTLGSSVPILASDSRTYAQWVTIPENTTLEALVGYEGLYGLKSTLENHWQGIKIYVKSSKPTYRLSLENAQVRPTGTIYTIVEAGDFILAPSIEGEGTITIYICTEMLAPGVSDVTWSSQSITIDGDNKQRISWGDTLGSNTHPDIGAYGTQFIFRYGNFNGWRFIQPAGGGAGAFRLVMWSPANVITTTAVSLGVEYTIPADTLAIMIDDYLIGNTFDVRMRSPL